MPKLYWRIGLIGLLLGAGLANASPITYTEQFVGTGTLNGTDFTSELVTLTAVADTSAVQNPSSGYFFVNGLSVMVDVASVGSDTLTNVGSAFVNQGGIAGIGDDTFAVDIVDTISAAFSTFDLQTAFGPVSGASFFSPVFLPTVQGAFKVTGVDGDSTFTATTVPEPASMAMLGLGLLAIAGLKRRSRSSAFLPRSR